MVCWYGSAAAVASFFGNAMDDGKFDHGGGGGDGLFSWMLPRVKILVANYTRFAWAVFQLCCSPPPKYVE